MYSNRQKAALFIFGLLSAVFAALALMVYEIESGRISILMASEPALAATTAMEDESLVSEWTGITMPPERDSLETESLQEASRSDYIVSSSVYADADETSAVISETMVYESTVSAVFPDSPELFGLLFPVFCILSITFLALTLFLFPKAFFSAGTDTAVLIGFAGALLLVSGFLPSRLYFSLQGSALREDLPQRLRFFLRDLLVFAVRIACVSGIVLTLRETLLFLFTGLKSERLLREKIFRKLEERKNSPMFHTVPAVLLLLFDTILLVSFVFITVWNSKSGRLLFLLPFPLFLFIFSVRSMLSGLRGMTSVRNQAIEEAVRNERLRVDLITNVSHDLRTPLTSILGYGTLLKNETLSESGTENLRLLNQKAGYMKDLVEALFELTKVSSGVLQCRKREIDLIRLLEQILGIFQDDLESAGLTVCRHYSQESMPMESDGAFLERVFANLVQNAVKYALPGTRIHLYAGFSKDGSTAEVRISNVSSYEMNFDPAEITERFVRGDESRTSRGSGLGLAIAKTYTEAVGGAFRIEIDGDVFSAFVRLPQT